MLATSKFLPFLLLTLAGPASGQHQQPNQSESSVRLGSSDSVAIGKKLFATNCGFCHGAAAQGGAQGGPDLTLSKLVRGDRNGVQLGAFLNVGRPEKGMPAFHLSANAVQAMAEFLHATIRSSGSKKSWGSEVLVGDSAAGRAFFEGAGRCAKCHSAQGDLQHIGSKYSPAVLQGRLVLPVGDGGYPGFSPPENPRIRATVTTADGKAVSGLLLFLSDYAVTIRESSGERRTIPRQGDQPQIKMDDPLQAHYDLQATLTDRQMHDLTAYLATLK